ncbi:MAG: 4-hydroxythreonine-4-phosphate dehydrogenase PdxA [Nitrospinae bacterium]|nr:4-hydroxythreonine-4-phosphate dehydrogenase PdxA [Nitrospinota bacterium]
MAAYPLPRFAITAGDPAGIGPEVSIKAIALTPPEKRRRLVLIADRPTLNAGLKAAKKKIRFAPFDAHKLPPKGCAAFYEMKTAFGKIALGKVAASAGRSAAEYIKTGVALSLAGKVSGIVTAPINKKALSLSGLPYPGHTEMLAALTGTQNYAMMLASPEMKVVVLSTHCSLKDAVKKVTAGAIAGKLALMNKSLKLKKPIGVCGLNPHASDGGRFGDEEEKIILPAIQKARKGGINAVGPLPADTAFAPRVRGKYGAFLAMYHDQGLVAIKSVSFGHCANITLGLPFVRTSVDHGTAFDIAGKGVADPSSMVYAIHTAFELAKT